MIDSGTGTASIFLVPICMVLFDSASRLRGKSCIAVVVVVVVVVVGVGVGVAVGVGVGVVVVAVVAVVVVVVVVIVVLLNLAAGLLPNGTRHRCTLCPLVCYKKHTHCLQSSPMANAALI